MCIVPKKHGLHKLTCTIYHSHDTTKTIHNTTKASNLIIYMQKSKYYPINFVSHKHLDAVLIC